MSNHDPNSSASSQHPQYSFCKVQVEELFLPPSVVQCKTKIMAQGNRWKNISDSLSAVNYLQAKHSAISIDLLYLKLKQSQQQQFYSAALHYLTINRMGRTTEQHLANGAAFSSLPGRGSYRPAHCVATLLVSTSVRPYSLPFFMCFSLLPFSFKQIQQL